jgi:hypothetical protein
MSRIPRTVWALCAVSFLTDVSTEMAIVIMPLFLTGTLGASVAFVGLSGEIPQGRAVFNPTVSARAPRLPR